MGYAVIRRRNAIWLIWVNMAAVIETRMLAELPGSQSKNPFYSDN